tara:strand:- start:678 stop:1115 length:438 start_codon:yes stop_codon:yes gene_type:complete
MTKTTKLTLIFFILLNFINFALAENTFYMEGKKKFELKNYEESKFLFQRSIVFDPKDYNSYLYLAKIYSIEENKIEEEKNVNTALLLKPNNEEANYLLMEIEIKKSNYTKVRELAENFSNICKKLCNKKNLILESLKNLEPKDES